MRLRVLYLDDEQDLCDLFKDYYEDDFDVSTFTDPDQMLAFVNEHEIDVALMDYRLPRNNGLNIAQSLPNTIVKAILTGELELDAGEDVARVFYKPFDLDELDTWLQQIDRKKKSA